jgi:hypothetical protein
MAKLYVFGIGGTGSRVIKSLTMLLASGIEINDFEIVPIIIDPDQANGDVTRTVDILKNYQYIRNKLSFSGNEENKFFKTKITNTTQNFKLELSDVRNDKFKDYIEYASLDESNKALLSLLFSDDNLNSDMEIGFKGNPNIGSVVLNQFKKSQDFKEFASSFGQEDRIFIVSSIFGGTGAAGFPLLLKNIRQGSELPNAALIQNAPIGAITMLPYFGVAPDENSKIDKATFISKAKAALTYYEKNVSGNNSINALYYIGDQPNNDYENNEGASTQKNDAHFLELAGALAIVDFARTDSFLLQNANGVAQNPNYKEFGIKNNVNEIIFSDLGENTQTIIKRNLTQYQLFNLYLKDQLKEATDQNWAKSIELDTFLTSSFYSSHLKTFNNYFAEWLKELESNKISFKPFDLEANHKNLFDMVKGKKPETSLLEKIGSKNYHRYNLLLSKNEPKVNSNSKEEKFMSLFYKTTEDLVKVKYNF